jgi:hypothetical protein
MFVPVVLGMQRIFLWAQAEARAADPILQAKEPYLNVPFFLIRAVIYFVFWMALVWVLNKWSDEQDRGIGTTTLDSVRFRKASAPGLLFLVLTVTFASVDWVMSLDPHWFSTVFGLLTMAGWGLTALAFAIAILALLAPDRAGRGAERQPLPRPREAAARLHDALGVRELLAVPDHLVGQHQRGDPVLPAADAGRLGADRDRAPGVPLRAALRAAALAEPEAAERHARQDRDLRARHAARGSHLARRADLQPCRARATRRTRGRLSAPLDGRGHSGGPDGHLAVPVRAQLRARPLFPANDPYFQEAFAHEAH